MLYHVTGLKRLPKIQKTGLRPSKEMLTPDEKKRGFKGNIFLTKPEGILFWRDNVAEHDLPVLLRTDADVDCEVDEFGSRDVEEQYAFARRVGGKRPKAKDSAFMCKMAVPQQDLEILTIDGWVSLIDYAMQDLADPETFFFSLYRRK